MSGQLQLYRPLRRGRYLFLDLSIHIPDYWRVGDDFHLHDGSHHHPSSQGRHHHQQHPIDLRQLQEC